MSISSGAPSGVTPGVVHDFDVADDSGDVSERLDLLVSRRCELSRTQAATLIATGQVTVNGNTEKASYRSLAGDRLHVVIPPPPGRDIIPENIPLDIVYEDEYLLVVNKAAGMVVHPAPGNWTGTLVNALIGRGEPLADGGSEEAARADFRFYALAGQMEGDPEAFVIEDYWDLGPLNAAKAKLGN